MMIFSPLSTCIEMNKPRSSEHHRMRWSWKWRKSSIAIIDLGRCPHSLSLCFSVIDTIIPHVDVRIQVRVGMVKLVRPHVHVWCHCLHCWIFPIFSLCSNSWRPSSEDNSITFLQHTPFEIIPTPFWDEDWMYVKTEREMEKQKIVLACVVYSRAYSLFLFSFSLLFLLFLSSLCLLVDGCPSFLRSSLSFLSDKEIWDINISFRH